MNRLFNGLEALPALDYLVKIGLVQRSSQPKPCIALEVGDRTSIDDSTSFQENVYLLGSNVEGIENAARLWRFLKGRQVQRPYKGDIILRRILESAIKEKPFNIFIPWGPRYSPVSRNGNSDGIYSPGAATIKEGDAEIKAMGELKGIFSVFSQLAPIKILIMEADAYGTEINRIPPWFVRTYFSNLERVLTEELSPSPSSNPDPRFPISVVFKPWSEIRKENQQEYTRLTDEIKRCLLHYISREQYLEAVKTARIFNPEKANESAIAYCAERLAEKEIIKNTIDPIKLSLVRKEKDSLDGDLPRLYIIKNKAPWLSLEESIWISRSL